MKLKAIKINSNGSFGWESENLEFGDSITQLYGPNGCGKTPIIQSIAYCLGYPSVFRNDIYDKCGQACLEIDINGSDYSINRKYIKGNKVDITILEPSGNTQQFFNEHEFSDYLFGILGIETENLVGNNNKACSPYMATLLPIFYLDQDEGYSNYYSPPSNFIKDQFSEMMRMIFDLPAKNSFNAKKGKIEAKDKLEYWDSIVHKQAKELEIAQENISAINKTSVEIKSEIVSLEEELENLKNSGATHDDSISAYDQLISNNKNEIRHIKSDLSEIHKRESSVAKIISEINTEIETLNINEEARRVFLAFNEVCASSGCQLFASSSDSYSKNLLYLKDQIKDLKRNTLLDSSRKEQLRIRLDFHENQLRKLVDDRNKALEKSEISVLVEAISEVKNQAFDLQNQLNKLEEVENIKRRNFEAINSRNTAFDKYQSYSSGRQTLPKTSKLKSSLRDLYVGWLDKFHTLNIRKDISFRDEFLPVLGEETISQLKGSTRARAVLSYHAALIELMTIHNGDKLNFLILDTPKQHEIHINDLNDFILELKRIADKKGIQIIFSTTEYHYNGDSKDKEWTPKFQGRDQKMFLRDKKT